MSCESPLARGTLRRSGPREEKPGVQGGSARFRRLPAAPRAGRRCPVTPGAGPPGAPWESCGGEGFDPLRERPGGDQLSPPCSLLDRLVVRDEVQGGRGEVAQDLGLHLRPD